MRFTTMIAALLGATSFASAAAVSEYASTVVLTTVIYSTHTVKPVPSSTPTPSQPPQYKTTHQTVYGTTTSYSTVTMHAYTTAPAPAVYSSYEAPSGATTAPPAEYTGAAAGPLNAGMGGAAFAVAALVAALV